MKIRTSIIAFSIIALICILVYCLYPKSGTLNSFLLSNYDKESIEEVELRSTYSGQDKSFRDKKEINEIISNISNIKLVQYYGSTKDRVKGSYHIYIYDKNQITEIYIQGKEYINIINDCDNSNKVYKIIDNSLNEDYINGLIL